MDRPACWWCSPSQTNWGLSQLTLSDVWVSKFSENVLASQTKSLPNVLNLPRWGPKHYRAETRYPSVPFLNSWSLGSTTIIKWWLFSAVRKLGAGCVAVQVTRTLRLDTNVERCILASKHKHNNLNKMPKSYHFSTGYFLKPTMSQLHPSNPGWLSCFLQCNSSFPKLMCGWSSML